MEVVVTTGAVRCAKLQSNRHLQQTKTQLFTRQMLFLPPNQQCQSTEEYNVPAAMSDLPVFAPLIVFCITESITRGTEITKVCNTSLASDRSTCKVCRILLSTSIQNCTFYYTMNYSIYLSNTVIMVGGIRSIGAGRTILVSAVSFSAL